MLEKQIVYIAALSVLWGFRKSLTIQQIQTIAKEICEAAEGFQKRTFQNE